MPSGLFCLNSLDWPIARRRSLWLVFISIMLYRISRANANSVDPNQTPRYVASDLGLYCLPLSLLWGINWLTHMGSHEGNEHRRFITERFTLNCDPFPKYTTFCSHRTILTRHETRNQLAVTTQNRRLSDSIFIVKVKENH